MAAINLRDWTSNANNLQGTDGTSAQTSSLPFATGNQRTLVTTAASSHALFASDSTSLSITDDMTIECWVRVTSTPSGNTMLVNKYNSTGSKKSWLFYQTNDDNTIRFTISSDGAAETTKSVTYTITQNTWTHLAVTYDASAGSCIFYVNGSAQGSEQTGLPTSIYNSTARLDIAAYNDTSTFSSTNQQMDDIRIWNDIRTPTEIANNYNIKLNGNEANLVAYYPFDFNGGTTPGELASLSLIDDANLVAYYRLEDVADTLGNNNLTNTNAVSFVPAKFNNGGDFEDSSSQYLRKASFTGFPTGNSSFSIVFWYKPESFDATAAFTHMTGADGAHTCHLAYSLLSGGNNKLLAEFGSGTGAITSGTNFSTGTLYHIAFVYNGTTHKMYVNGVEDATTSYSSANLTAGAIAIGAFHDGSGYYFDGILDDWAIFDRVLTPAEIKTIYQGGIAIANDYSYFL